MGKNPPNNNKPKRRRMPGADYSGCKESTPEETLEFILGIRIPDWEYRSSRIGEFEGRSVTHFFIAYKGNACICSKCGQEMKLYDHKERAWRHANLDKTVCYIHADIPRFRCEHCGTVIQADVPWADPNLSYSNRFMEVAIDLMSSMSLNAVTRFLYCSWTLLDGIVGRMVDGCLDRMDLSEVRRIRIDETSAKKHHRYITVVTDADTDEIIFITKGKDREVVREFAYWLCEHNGDPGNIELVASDFGEAFISGAGEYLPNAESVLDPFHLIQLGNQKLDKDRASNQINGQRLKSIRYALLKNECNLSEEEKEIVFDITRDNEIIGRSYEMNMSLRQAFAYGDVRLTARHLVKWTVWVLRDGSKGFKALANTVRKHFKGILKAVQTGINNGFQESLNGRIQFSKRIANGYHREERLARIVFFRQFAKKSRGFC